MQTHRRSGAPSFALLVITCGAHLLAACGADEVPMAGSDAGRGDGSITSSDLGRADGSRPLRDGAVSEVDGALSDVDGGGLILADSGTTLDAGPPPRIPHGAIYANEFMALWRVNDAASSATLIAAITFTGTHVGEEILDIAFSPDGVLYASGADGLYTLDPDTAAATFVGANTATCNGLSWVGDADGFLFCTAFRPGSSYSVDTGSGVATRLGDTDPTYVTSGDNVYVPALSTTYVSLTVAGMGADHFAPIDTTTGAAGVSNPTDMAVWGLAYRGAEIIGFTSTGSILTIATDGTFTVRGTTTAMFAGAATRP